MSFLATFVKLIYSSTNNIIGQIERAALFLRIYKSIQSLVVEA